MRALGQQEDREAALAALAEDLAAREAQVTQLEAEIEQLKRFDAEAGSSLTRHEALLATMRKQQGEHDAKAAQQRAEIERLAGEIDERERRIVALLQELDQERARVQALEDDARVLQQQLSALEAEQEIDRQQRSSRKGPAHGAELRRLRGEVASLSQHIENRNRIWREQKEALAGGEILGQSRECRLAILLLPQRPHLPGVLEGSGIVEGAGRPPAPILEQRVGEHGKLVGRVVVEDVVVYGTDRHGEML
jgi:chromosome segregation ATPase